jgi:hypothetical protein
MKTIPLTVLTESLPAQPAGIIPLVKRMVRPLKSLISRKPGPQKRRYGGHYAVTRSLVEGLRKIGADFNYNPEENKIAETVLVLSGPSVLRNAIRRKNKGEISFLLAGPNIADSVLDEDGIVGDPAVDYFIVPSSWIEKNVIGELPTLKGRVLCWYAGVDVEYWKPRGPKQKRKVLVYWKTEKEEFCSAVETTLIQKGYTPVRITYGKYISKEYKQALDQCQFAVFLSRSESQGVALAESWSMDVPTLVWDPGELFFRGKAFEQVSACPYLSPETGQRWGDLPELEKLLDGYDNYKDQFNPRAHTVRNFSDEVCAQSLLHFISATSKSQ